ncbi:MAG: class I SAM-dependent methyltransferase [Vicinamibacterales bacterium]
MRQGWHGWDAYAPFYDWENAQTVGRRDIPFWVDLAVRVGGPVLELGCGTGRVSLPVARRAEHFVGIDRSPAMLDRLRRRFRRARLGRRAALVMGDIRALPFRKRVRFKAVMAPYGMLQSLLRDRDLAATLRSVSGVVARGGVFAVDLVPDLPRWQEYHRRVSLRGRRPGGGQLTLIESVRQDHDRRLTIFDQEYVERRDGRRETHRFSLAFRTLTVPQISRRLERAGFTVDAVLGDYRGRAWSPEADVWLILARRR